MTIEMKEWTSSLWTAVVFVTALYAGLTLI